LTDIGDQHKVVFTIRSESFTLNSHQRTVLVKLTVMFVMFCLTLGTVQLLLQITWSLTTTPWPRPSLDTQHFLCPDRIFVYATDNRHLRTFQLQFGLLLAKCSIQTAWWKCIRSLSCKGTRFNQQKRLQTYRQFVCVWVSTV